MIQAICDRCERPWAVPDSQAGQKITCPNCGDVRRAPDAASTPAAPAHAPTPAAPAPGSIADRTAKLGLPPAEGPEVTVLTVRSSMGRAKPFVFILHLIALLGGAIGAGILAFRSEPWWAYACLALAVLAAGSLFVWWLKALSQRLEITNKRVILKRGLLSRATSEVLHRTILEIEVVQSLPQRLLGVGTIKIDNSAEESDEIVATDIADPHRVRRTIDAYRPM